MDPADLPAVDGVAHHWADVDGVTLHWAQAGPDDAPPIVLLHGWPQHWFSWRHQIVDLARDHLVIAPDLRGHGWSDAPPASDGAYRKDRLAQDVLGLLDHLDIARFDLVGHDWGGWTSFLLGLRAPDRVRSVSAFSIAHPFQRVTPRKLLTLWRFWYQALVSLPVIGTTAVKRADLVGHLLRNWGTAADDAWGPGELEAFTSRLQAPDRAHVSTAMYRTFLTRELPAILAGRYRGAWLTPPTRLVVGTADRPIARSLLDGADLNANDLTVHLVEGAGHFLPEERPDLVTAHIREHVGRPAPAEVV